MTWLQKVRRQTQRTGNVTHALSVLLNFALLTSSLRLPMKACFRTSLPICSPSRSQSVQMNKILETRACFCMFFAMLFLSCSIFSPCLIHLPMCTHVVNTIDDWRIEKLSRRTGLPALVLRLEVKAREVAEHARHSHRAITPLLKIEVEFIVLDILISWDGMLRPWSVLQDSGRPIHDSRC